MLTEVKAYSSWRSSPILQLSGERAETDLIQIRNIDGLDPVKASVNTSPYGSVDGASYVGSRVLSRNIVMTLHPNPDWNTWTYESLRRLLYSYFMPKNVIKLVFYSDDMDPVQILGIVEDISPNLFSKDPEILVSIICPDPYFTSFIPKVITGLTDRIRGDTISINYEGSIESGIHIKVTSGTGTAPTSITVEIQDPNMSFFTVDATVDNLKYFEMSSIPTKKFVQNVYFDTGVIESLLSNIRPQDGSYWPTFQPGINEFAVFTDTGDHNWTLTYSERFGGL